MTDTFGYIYACTVLTAGFWEYYKTKSFCSLGVDLVCGGALACGAYLVSEDPDNYMLQLVTSLTVVLVMAYRYFNSNRWLPSVVVVALSCVMIVRIGTFLTIRGIIQAFAEILKPLFPDDRESQGLQPG